MFCRKKLAAKTVEIKNVDSDADEGQKSFEELKIPDGHYLCDNSKLHDQLYCNLSPKSMGSVSQKNSFSDSYLSAIVAKSCSSSFIHSSSLKGNSPLLKLLQSKSFRRADLEDPDPGFFFPKAAIT